MFFLRHFFKYSCQVKINNSLDSLALGAIVMENNQTIEEDVHDVDEDRMTLNNLNNFETNSDRRTPNVLIPVNFTCGDLLFRQ